MSKRGWTMDENGNEYPPLPGTIDGPKPNPAFEVYNNVREHGSVGEPKRSVLQDWVMELGLRHQGVLVSAIRGCDSVPKDDPAKSLIRAYRGEILNCHCGNPDLASSFIEWPPMIELGKRMGAARSSFDHYPIHFVLHLVHAAEILAYYHPDVNRRTVWLGFYLSMCRKMHVTAETKAELDARLNADEETFARLAA